MESNIIENKAIFYMVKEAVDKLLIVDKFLLEKSGLERSIAFRLGLYLNSILRRKKNVSLVSEVFLEDKIKLDVDLEYSKNGESTKEVYLHCHNYRYCGNCCYICTQDSKVKATINNRNEYFDNLRSYIDKIDRKNMIPDILVHKRGENNHNLIAIEVKCNDDEKLREADFGKLTYLTCTKDDCEYKYKIGIFIEFSKEGAKYCIFEEGRIVWNEFNTKPY
ncbi:MAG: hypothetical protein RR571_05715 [Anaerorhabdus sp.]